MMNNIKKTNIELNKNTNEYKNIIKNFNIIIGISFILLVSIIYITAISSINISNNYKDLSILEKTLSKELIYFFKILFSFLIPLSFFIFMFLFILNPIDLKSMIISFILIFLIINYLYRLPYSIIIEPIENFNLILNLSIDIIIANLLIIFIIALSYINYDIKKLNTIQNFYTMIAEITIWTSLILFIIFLIICLFIFIIHSNNKIIISNLIKFLTRNNLKNAKIILSIFIILKTSIIYISYIIYNKMKNTKLSIRISRTIIILNDIALIVLITFFIIYHKYNVFILIIYTIFLIITELNLYFFRIDKKHKKIESIIYIISNIISFIFSIFVISFYFHIKTNINTLYIILINSISVNFIYNILMLKKYINFIFLYNYVYIILFIIKLVS